MNLSQKQSKTRTNFDIDSFNQYSIVALIIDPLDRNRRRVAFLKKTFYISYHQPMTVKKMRNIHYGFGMRKSNYYQISQNRPLTQEQKKTIEDALINLTQQCDIDTEIYQYYQKIQNEKQQI